MVRLARNRSDIFTAMKHRRLTPNERFEIVRERKKGVSPEALAKRFGVTKRAIYYTVASEKERKDSAAIRDRSLNVKLTEREISAFDDVLRRHQIDNRAVGLRALIRTANGMLGPDAQLHGELFQSRVALNRIGNNVSQIAKRMNEAKLKGRDQHFSNEDLAEMRQLAGMVMAFGDQLHQIIEGRRAGLEVRVSEALKAAVDAP